VEEGALRWGGNLDSASLSCKNSEHAGVSIGPSGTMGLLLRQAGKNNLGGQLEANVGCHYRTISVPRDFERGKQHHKHWGDSQWYTHRHSKPQKRPRPI